jgi:hypothetical protein
MLLAPIRPVFGASGDPGSAPPAQEWPAFGRSILKQLIEINSTHGFGSTGAAHVVADRLIAAGFPHRRYQAAGAART